MIKKVNKSLKCPKGAKCKHSYQWRQQESVKVIKQVTMETAGKYRCRLVSISNRQVILTLKELKKFSILSTQVQISLQMICSGYQICKQQNIFFCQKVCTSILGPYGNTQNVTLNNLKKNNLIRACISILSQFKGSLTGQSLVASSLVGLQSYLSNLMS